MGNTATIQTGSAKDKVVARMIASLSDGVNALGTPGRYCQFVCRPSGESIGYAYISIPVGSLADEYAPKVAMRQDGPCGKVKMGTAASCGYSEGGNYVPLLNGTLVSYVHTFGEDSALGIVFDARWDMTKITCFGRMIYDPVEMVHYFDPTQRLIFNELGWPSCLDTPFGPRFAPCYRYGYKQQYGALEDLTEPTPGNAQNRTRSWTSGDILDYLRAAHYCGEGNKRPADLKYYGNHFLGPNIVWPSSASGIVGNIRPVNHFDIQNDSLLIGLQKTARTAGAYDILVKPSGSTKSTLSFVDMGSRDKEGAYLYTPDYLDENELLTSNSAIQSGFIKEDITNYFDETVIIGDPIAEERMLSTGTGGTGAGGIEAAWDRGGGAAQYDFTIKASDASDEGMFLKFLADNEKSQRYFEMATHTWPLVFCAYRIKKGYQMWKGTKYDGMSNQGPHAAMRPVLLTGAQQNSSNPANWLPREVIVELAFVTDPPGDDSSWTPPVNGRYDGMTLSPDGQIIYFPALRDISPDTGLANSTWVAKGGGTYDPANIKPNNIRFTIAANSDWSLTGFNQADPNGTKARVSQGGSTGMRTFSYQVVAEPLDYVEYLRGGGDDDSWPNGKAAMKNPNNGDQLPQSIFPARATSGNELFSDLANDAGGNPGRIVRHAQVRQVDVRRVANGGSIVQAKLNPSIEPGMAVSLESASPIKCNSIVKSVTWDGNQQTTTIELQAADESVIYDLPMPAGYDSAPAASGGQSGDSPGYLNQDNYSYTETKGGKGSKAGDDVSPSDAEGSGAGKVDDVDDEPRRTSATRGAGRATDGNADSEEADNNGKKSSINFEGKPFDPQKKDRGATLEGQRMTPNAPPTPGIKYDRQTEGPIQSKGNSLNGESLPELKKPLERGITQNGTRFEQPDKGNTLNGVQIPPRDAPHNPVAKKPLQQSTRESNNETD